MVVIDVSYKKLKKDLGLDIEEIRKVLFDFGMELNKVEDDTLSIEITAERTDLISYQGILRALKIYLGKQKFKDYVINKSNYKIIVDKKNKTVRPYTAAAVIKGLKLTEDDLVEIIRVQEKLHSTLCRNRTRGAIGVYPMDKIKWPIRFTCDFPEKISFIPLESSKAMSGKEILSKHPTGIKYAYLLEELKNYPYFIDSANNILSMPPIINSQITGKVTEKTKDVFIEVSGSDLKVLNEVLIHMITMLADMGGKVYSVNVIYSDKKTTTPQIRDIKLSIDAEYVNKTLGTSLSLGEISKLLTRMMHKTKVKGKSLEVIATGIRSDVWHKIDLVDDVARAYGFSNIKPTTPKNDSTGETVRLIDIKEKVSDIMVGAGSQEIVTFGLSSVQNQIQKMSLSGLDLVGIQNSNDVGINCVRRWLLPEGMLFLENNSNKKYPQKVFECGFVVVPDDKKDTKTRNELHISSLVAGSGVDYSKGGEFLKHLSDVFGFDLKVEEHQHPSFIGGRVGRILHKGKEVGVIGEIHPIVLKNFKLVVPVVGFELNLSEIFGE